MTVNAAWNIWNFRRHLVQALIADGHEVMILAPEDHALPRLESLGCSVRHLEMNVKGLNPLHDSSLLLRMRRHFQELRPDVILSYTIKNNIFGALAAKTQRIPFIPNVTGLGTAFLSGGLLERVAVTLYRGAFHDVPVVLFQNEDDRNLFLERRLVTDKQARCLPGSGIDLDQFVVAAYPSETDAPIFLMIARLLRDKGVLEYVAAARMVKARHPKARFQLLGSIDAKNRTAIDRDTVRSWQSEGVIEYLGTVEDVRPVIAKAQCVVLPSYREGAPRTLIEAAAMGRPLIATDVPGCRAVVDDGKSGFLCKVRNTESLAAVCEAFIELPLRERETLGHVGRAKMEKEYCDTIVLQTYRAILRDTARSRSSVLT